MRVGADICIKKEFMVDESDIEKIVKEEILTELVPVLSNVSTVIKEELILQDVCDINSVIKEEVMEEPLQEEYPCLLYTSRCV